MSINACSINRFTIDGTCRRRVPLEVLIGKPRSIPKLVPGYVRRNEDFEVDITKLEGPNILIKVEFDGQVHQINLDNPALEHVPTPMVAVTHLEANDATINIAAYDLQVINTEKLEEPK